MGPERQIAGLLPVQLWGAKIPPRCVSTATSLVVPGGCGPIHKREPATNGFGIERTVFCPSVAVGL